MKFSLILPVYGVEKYIGRCIESCCTQHDFPSDDFELIIVDDESPDNSISVARGVLDKYPTINFKIITRPNGGLSAARNTGLEHAIGDYIWFVDSDDYIVSNALKTLSDALTEHPGCEIVSFGYATVYPNKRIEHQLPVSLRNKTTDGFYFLKNNKFLSACSRIYSHKFLKSVAIRFTEGILWEDGEFNLKVLSLTKKHYGLGCNLYNYLRHPNSISTGRHLIRTLDSNLKIFDNHCKWVDSHDFNSITQLPVLATFLSRSIIFTLAGIPELHNSALEKHYFQQIKNRAKQFYNFASICDDPNIRRVRILFKLSPVFSAWILHRRMNGIMKPDSIHIEAK